MAQRSDGRDAQMKIILVRHKSPDAGDNDVKPLKMGEGDFKLYSSPDSLACKTADLMWDESYETIDALDEIAADESKADAFGRASSFIDMIESEGCDVIAVSHEGIMKMMFKALKKRGYIIRRTNLFKIDYLEKAVATKRADHCGNCSQNCHLSNPACDIGREKALRRKDAI